MKKEQKNKTLIIGADLIAHENSENIAKFIGLIQKYSDWKVVIIPTQTNTLGVSQICDISDLDYNSEFKNSVGYNIKAQTTISAFDGDFSVPALNQQEGTFTTIDKKVVKLYPAIDFNGISFERIFKLDNKLKGVVGINPFFDKSLDIYKIISNYRFAKVKIEKI